MAQAIHPGAPERPSGPRPVVNFPSRPPPRWRWAFPVGLLVLIAAAGVLYMTGQWTTLQRRLLGQSTAVTYQTATVAKGTISDTVPATGPIAAAQTLPLSFKSSGKLADLKVVIGQKVKKGDVLAQIDTTDLQAALDQAKANLQQVQAAFAKVQTGASPELLQAAQVALTNAQQAANDAAASAAAAQASAAKDVEAAQASAATSSQSLKAAQDGLAAAQAQTQTSAATAQNSLKAAQDGLAAARDQAQQKLVADQTAVDNAQKSLDAARNLVATSPAILKQQLEKAKDDLWAAQISRDQACSRGGGGTCDAAKATVAGIETSVTNFNATSQQTVKQNEQTVQSAQNAVETAKATLTSDQTAQAAAIKTAENAVTAAEAAVNTTQTTQAAAIKTAENAVAAAAAGVNSAQTSIGQSQAKAVTAAQSAKQTANNAVAGVKTAEASLNTTGAAPTKADVDSAAAQVANAQVALKTAQNNLDGATLTAPMDGSVTAISGTIGQWVTGGAVTTSATSATGGLITLATLDDLQVTASVNEADVGKVKLRDPVSFTLAAFPGKTFTGEVTQIQPTGTTTSNVVNFAVTSSIKSTEGVILYPGMTANLTVTTQEHANVLVVPSSALTFAQSQLPSGGSGRTRGGNATATAGGAPAATAGGSPAATTGGSPAATAGGAPAATAGGSPAAILVLQNGQPVPKRVTVGMTDGTNTEISTGLNEGDAVVIGQTGGSTTARAATAKPQNSSPLTGGGPGFKPGG